MIKKMRIFDSLRNPFKRKRKRYSDYVIDLGKLKDRGIIQEPVEAETINIESPDTTSSETETESSGLGFLGSLAGAGGDETTSTERGTERDSFSSYNTTRTSRESGEKIDMISERIYKLIERIDLLEHKMGRVEKRMGVGETY